MSKVAVILELRKHKELSFVLNNVLNVLPTEWNIQILHGNQNKQYLDNLINKDPLLNESKSRIILTNILIDYITPEETSSIILTEDYWNRIIGDTILIFQCDTILCENSKYKISDFEHFDYIGGYWGIKLPPLYSKYNWVMNGGLSLRKKQYMLDIIKYKLKDYILNGGNPCEDYFVSNCNLYLPTVKDVLSFSIDNGYQAPYDNDLPFGFHKPWGGNPSKGHGRAYNIIKELYPKVEILKKLQENV